MLKRRVWRYTCEHCKKSNCSSSAMRTHELRCFKNPNRRCPVCEAQWPLDCLKEPMAAMAEINKDNEEALIKAISDKVESCPACTFAAIIQAPVAQVESGGENSDLHRYWITWDYKKARDEYRAEQRAEEASHYL